MNKEKSCDTCYYNKHGEKCQHVEKGSYCILKDYKNWRAKIEICYKTSNPCKHDCKSICRESV